ncbi:MAG: YihY/virulence factor BrkB family protein, partial [Alphaproteobacteria bacterium]|nr:YihY/virulence factor BrkB family protein [Alphaproteobacteria bacterium]
YSAAAAYFAVFSLPGLMIIVVSITTFFLDEQLVRTHIHDYIGQFMGQDVAQSVEDVIDKARLNSTGFVTLLVGAGILLFGATGLFNQLKISFNAVWSVHSKPEKALLRLVVYRAISLGVAVMVGFLLLMSMYLSAGLKIFAMWLISHFPDLGFLKIVEIGMSFLTISILFTMIFKILPDVKIKLKYAFAGGLVSSFLFMLGELGFAKAISVFAPESVFGAAGSIVLLMIWVTYGCSILQFGAEFIKALMSHHEEEVRYSRFVKSRYT